MSTKPKDRIEWMASQLWWPVAEAAMKLGAYVEVHVPFVPSELATGSHHGAPFIRVRQRESGGIARVQQAPGCAVVQKGLPYHIEMLPMGDEAEDAPIIANWTIPQPGEA